MDIRERNTSASAGSHHPLNSAKNACHAGSAVLQSSRRPPAFWILVIHWKAI